jgi:hypothetical protein
LVTVAEDEGFGTMLLGYGGGPIVTEIKDVSVTCGG